MIYKHSKFIKGPLLALLLSASMLVSSCSGGTPKPSPTPTPPVVVNDGSFEDGTGADLGFKLLYALDSFGGNGILGTAGIEGCLAAIKVGSSGGTDVALAAALGMQDLLPKDIESAALHLVQASGGMKTSWIATAWSLFMGENQYIKESYITDCKQSLQLDVRPLPQKYDNASGNKFLGEWADDGTGGRVKTTNFNVPQPDAPFFVDISIADPDWQTALETGKTRPLPFQFEDGDSKAVPTMVCQQNCGIYAGSDGSMAVLPTAGDETRLLIMVPPEMMSLHDFIPVAALNFNDWLGKAEWGKQRVLLPKFKMSYEDSIMKVLDKAGFAGLLKKGSDFSNMGDDLYYSDILHKASLTIDESGIDPPDPDATYNQGVKDSIPTLAANKPFIVALIKTPDDNGGGGQILMMGFVRDPLNTVAK
jgi:serine protease inhibitor